MDKGISWQETKKNLNGLTEIEKAALDMEADVIAALVKGRANLGVSQRDLEKLTRVSKATITRIETFENSAKLGILSLLLATVGLKLAVVPLEK